MKLLHLMLHRLPGFKQKGFVLQDLFCGGLNVIYGPNGIGKSLSCQAVRALIWPNQAEGLSPVSIDSVWQSEEGEVAIGLEEGIRTVFPKKASGLLARFPAGELAFGYTMSIDNLFHAKDRNLAGTILTEAMGGFDLEKAVDSLQPKVKTGQKEGLAADRARQEIEQAKKRVAHLEALEAEAKDIEERIARSQAAGERLLLLEKIGQCEEARSKLCGTEAVLGGYVAGMDTLMGNELEQLSDVQDRIEELADEVRHVQSRIEEAQKIADGHRQIAGRAKEAGLEAMREENRRLAVREELLAKAKRELAGNAAVLEEAQRFLKLEDWKNIDVEKLSLIKALWQEIEKTELRLAELDSKIKVLSSLRDAPDAAVLKEAVHLSVELEHFKKGLWFCLAAALPLFFAFWKENVYLLPLVLLPLLILGSWRYWLKRRLKKRRLPKGSEALMEELSLALCGQKERQWLLRLQEERAKQEELQKGQMEKMEAEGGPWPCALLEFLDRVKDAHELQKKICDGTLRIEGLQKEIAAARDLFLRLLDLPQMEAKGYAEKLAAIEQKTRDYDAALSQLKKLPEELEGLQNKLARAKEKKVVLLGVFKSEEGLRKALAGLESYRQCKKDKAIQEVRQKELGQLIGRMPDEVEIAAWRQQKESDSSLFSELEKLLQEKGFNEAELKRGKEERVMEAALENFEKGKEEYLQACERRSVADGVVYLAQQVLEQYNSVCSPAVLKRAGKYFAQFTHGRYELLLPDKNGEGAEMLCRDSETKELKLLDMLSRATRMQLVMAVRLAFIGQEAKEELPLFFDEVLGVADEERFEAVAQVLLELAKGGRQIFYFTSQKSDLQRWQNVAKAFAFSDLALIDMERMQKEERKALVQQEDISWEAYRKELGAIDFSEGVGQVPIGHLLEEKDDWQTLLRKKIGTYGQFMACVKNGLSYFTGDIKKILDKGEVLEEAFRLHAIGRGKKVSLKAFEEAEVSRIYLERLLELSKESRHDGKVILQILQSRADERFKGFRGDILERMREKWLELGYLAEEERLSLEELKLGVMRFMAERASLAPSEANCFLDKILSSL